MSRSLLGVLQHGSDSRSECPNGAGGEQVGAIPETQPTTATERLGPWPIPTPFLPRHADAGQLPR